MPTTPAIAANRPSVATAAPIRSARFQGGLSPRAAAAAERARLRGFGVPRLPEGRPRIAIVERGAGRHPGQSIPRRGRFKNTAAARAKMTSAPRTEAA